MAEEILKTGDQLGIERKRGDWPKIVPVSERPIEILRPGSDRHDRVLRYLLRRLDESERQMGRFYARWRVSEKKIQGYVDLPQWENELKKLNDEGKPPKVVSITIPYTFAVIETAVTFLLHVFTGRRPMFQVGTYKEESVEAARLMELVLQYQADHTRLARHLRQFLWDALLYGVGVLRVDWTEKFAVRTVWRERQRVDSFTGMPTGETEFVRSRERRLVYEGNIVVAQDPFLFFPDPRVPMTEVNRRGEYVFWRTYEGRHALLRAQAEGQYMWVHEGISKPLPVNPLSAGPSSRSLVAGGEPEPGRIDRESGPYVQVDQGSVEIIPRELGIGESDVPEKWLFTILNRAQIVQAEPLGMDHEMHPVAVAEPFSMGYGFGNVGLADYVNPLQDTISWLVNSHIANVRKVLNDVLLVKPGLVEMQDLKNLDAGGVVRLKQAAIGMDPQAVVQQLAVQDVTAGHMADAQNFFRFGLLIAGVNENVMGTQQFGGRKTATEVRTASTAAVSRLTAMARTISAQALTDLTEQMAVNTQSFLSQEFYIQVVGAEGQRIPIRVRPEMVAGDFYFPVHDGTVPLDRVALVDVWREILQAVMADPELRQRYDVARIFEWVAELGGARNIEGFRISVAPPGEPGRVALEGATEAARAVEELGRGGGGEVPPASGEALLRAISEALG